MLMDGRQVALNQVIEALREAEQAHEQAAEQLGADAALAERLRGLARRRRDDAAEVADHVRRLGELPAEPDADRQAAKGLLARLQAALAEDERDRALQHCRHAEERLAEAVREALDQDLAADTRALLVGLLAVPELSAALG